MGDGRGRRAQVYSGQSLAEAFVGSGLSQELLLEGGAEPLDIPQNGKIFAYVWLDPKKTRRIRNHDAVPHRLQAGPLGTPRRLGR